MKKRQGHRKPVKHFHDPEHAHELAFSCYRRMPLLPKSSEYIHNNPVKRGLCLRAVDWKWSSPRYYHNTPPRQQHPNLPMIHGLPEGAVL